MVYGSFEEFTGCIGYVYLGWSMADGSVWSDRLVSKLGGVFPGLEC